MKLTAGRTRRRLAIAGFGLVTLLTLATLLWALWPAPPPDLSEIQQGRGRPPDHVRQLAPRTARRACRFDMEASAGLVALDAARDLSEAEPALGRLLDAGACDRIGVAEGRLPTASLQRWFDAAIDTLRAQGDRNGALRWSTDGLALASDLAVIGRLDTTLAAIDLAQDLSVKAAEDLAAATPDEASRTAEVASWARAHPGPLSAAIDAEMTSISRERWRTASELTAHAEEAAALEAERRLWMTFVSVGDVDGAPPRTARYLDGTAILAGRDKIRENDRRYRALVVLGAAVASRPDPSRCRPFIDAMREAVPKDVLPPNFLVGDLRWDPDACTLSLLEPDGTVAERYAAVVTE